LNNKNKKVLILCTGNSCRSIIAEALINAELENIEAQSSGVKASGRVNPNAKKILEENNIWSEHYHSKTIDKVLEKSFDLVVTVCGNAQESCPTFPQKTKVIHVGFEDPDGHEYSAFQECYHDIKNTLLPHVKKALQ
jgi:arsenate reductase